MRRDQLQGGLLRGYKHRHARHLLAQVRDPSAARTMLATLAADVTPEDAGERAPDVTLNVLLSCAGLAVLGVRRAVLDGFPEEFSQGMAKRVAVLGDDRTAYQPGLQGLQVIVSVQARDADAVVGATRARRAQLEAGGLHVTGEQEAALLPAGDGLDEGREHFGFTDGFSQPAIAGFRSEQVPGQGVPYRRWGLGPLRWRPVAPGEFVLGERDEDGAPPPAPPAPFDRDTTFVVWRKLEQDVAGFRAQLDEQARRTGMSADELAARLVGRWKDGSPLALTPDQPDPRLGAHARLANDFAYASDPEGLRCPRGAHVRRVNPRDALGWEGRLTARHRILRRGMPYGPPLAAGEDPADAERGLIFISVQASIKRQFEVIQGQWCNDGNAFGLGHDPDPIAGPAGRVARPIVTTCPPRIAGPLRSCVTCRGGEYLVAPSRAALRALPVG